MSSITVAIWMVTYNHEDYIEQAIRSIMQQQTNFNFKLFIGEDCSTDKTKFICEQLQTEFPDKIELILNQENLGSTQNARNTYARCYQYQPNYIALLEGDDYWTDNLKLQQQVDFLETNKDYGMCFTRFKTFDQYTKNFEDDKNGRYFKEGDEIIDFNFNTFANGWHVGLQTLVFEAKIFSVDVIEKYQYFKDINLIIELLLNKKGACLNIFGSVYRIHDFGIYNSNTTMKNAELGLLCYKELYEKNQDEPLLKLKYNNFYKYYIKNLIANKYFFKAFINITKFSILNLDLFYFRNTQKKLFCAIFSKK